MSSVTFIIGQLILGGAEKQLYLLARGLVARGWEVSVITLHSGHGDYWEQPIRDLGVEVCEVDTTSHWKAITKIVAFLQTKPGEILHSWSTFTGLYAVLGARLAGIPLCLGSQRSSEKYVIGELGLLPYWLSYCAFPGITANSRLGMAELQRRFPGKKIAFIPNGIDASKFSHGASPDRRITLRQKFGIPTDLFLVGSVGLMAQVKRYDLLIEAVGLLQRNGVPCGLAIFGDGPQMRELTEQAGHRLAPGSFFFPGFVQQAEDCMAVFDVFCLTSDYEGTPNVIMEALAAGLPVASTGAGDTGALIQNGATGLILPSNQPAVIAHAIQELIDRPDLRAEIGRNGKAFIQANYSTSIMVDSMVAFYHEMINRLRPGVRDR